MFPFQSLNTFALQLLFYSNLQNSQMGYFNPMGFNSQIFNSGISNQNLKYGFQPEIAKLTANTPETTEKIEQKSPISKSDKKQLSQQEAIKSLEKNEEKKNPSKELKKPKRPPTYLTEKAFYMKQKIKGKVREEKRILRNRVSMNSKDKLRSAKKKHESKCKEQRKKIVIAKTEKIEKKQLDKIIKKVMKQHRSPFAVIPNKISGVYELNEFCRQKMENLMKQKISY